MHTFEVTVVTPEAVVYEDTAWQVSAKNHLGYFGIRPRHAPFLTALVPGRVVIKSDEESHGEVFAVSGGCLEVNQNKCVVLADTVEKEDEIDVHRAEEARDRCLQELKKEGVREVRERLRSALARAENRLSVAGKRSA